MYSLITALLKELAFFMLVKVMLSNNLCLIHSKCRSMLKDNTYYILKDFYPLDL